MGQPFWWGVGVGVGVGPWLLAHPSVAFHLSLEGGGSRGGGDYEHR